MVTELEHTNSITIDNQSVKAQPDIYKEEQQRGEHGGVQMSSSNSFHLGYHYVNINNPSGAEQGKNTIKIPQLPAKLQKEFLSTTFEQVGLQGPPTGVKLIEWSYDS